MEWIVVAIIFAAGWIVHTIKQSRPRTAAEERTAMTGEFARGMLDILEEDKKRVRRAERAARRPEEIKQIAWAVVLGGGILGAIILFGLICDFAGGK
jgi:hypothetical protein